MLEEITSLARLDFSPRHRQPAAGRVLLATLIAVAGSLAADAVLVAIAEAVFPGTRGYVHFRFPDYVLAVAQLEHGRVGCAVVAGHAAGFSGLGCGRGCATTP